MSSERAGVGRWTTQAAERVHAKCGHACVLCASKRRLHAHHLDPVWHNPSRARDEANLVSLCGSCHDALHAGNLELELLAAFESGADLRSFWSGRSAAPRPAGKPRPRVRRLVRDFKAIARIELAGEEMTYDLEVEGPFHNFVANGFIVHNSVNEYSGRYSLMPMLFYTPPADQLQTQSPTNNQGRSGMTASPEVYAEALRRWQGLRDGAADAYGWLTGLDVARELARIDLPLSTYTQWYWKIDLHNLLHFLTLRVDAHAQWEIQEYGKVMAGMLKRVAPISYEAWIDYDVQGARLSRMELAALRRLLETSGGGIAARSGALSAADLEAEGLSKREVRELLDKLQAKEPVDFTLDLGAARDGAHFARKFAQFVPSRDREPPEA